MGALARAARSGSLLAAKRLLRQTPDAAKAWQPIMHACFRGDAAMVRLLLDCGADPNALARSQCLHRPLHRTVEHRISGPKHKGHVETVRLLLQAGADPTVRATSWRMTPVTLAAIAGGAEMVEMLLPRLGEIDIFTAAAVGDAGRVRCLLRHDAWLARKTDEAGCTALWYCAASRLRHRDLRDSCELLLASGADPNHIAHGGPPLYFALGHSDNVALAELLLAGGADVHAGTSLLHASCEFHFQFLAPALSWLIGHGADPNARDRNSGQTPLHKAAYLGYTKAVRALLEARADPTLRDAAGLTPLDLARRYRKRGAAASLEQVG